MLLPQSLKQQHITLIVLWHIILNFVTHPIDFSDIGFDLMANARRGVCRHLRASSLHLFLLLTVCIWQWLKAPFVILVLQLPFSSELGRRCPGCVNFMHGKHTDWFSVRKLVWNQHICEHDSLWSLSVINYLCTEESQETISKDKLLCISSFLIFKGNACMEYLCWCSWWTSNWRGSVAQERRGRHHEEKVKPLGTFLFFF